MVIYQRSRRTNLADIAIVVFVSALAFLGELAFATHLADLGFRRPARWATVPAWAFGILVVFVVAQNVVPLLVAPFFDLPEPDMSRYDAVRGNLAAAVSLALLLPLTAAIPEEILYRGFLIERLARVFAGTKGAPVLAVLAQALMFGSVHFQWGIGGIVVTAIMGAVWGFAFLLCGRNLWIVIIAHSAAHIAMLTQLYFAPPPQ